MPVAGESEWEFLGASDVARPAPVRCETGGEAHLGVISLHEAETGCSRLGISERRRLS